MSPSAQGKTKKYMNSRKIRLAIAGQLLLVLFNAGTCYAELSLDETVAWLKENLTGLSASLREIKKCENWPEKFAIYTTITRKIESLSVDEGILKINGQDDTDVTGLGDMTSPKRLSIPLKDLYVTCSVKKVNSTSASSPCTSSLEIPYELSIAGRHNEGVHLWIQDEDLARRICKRFQHLLKLSGAQEELFGGD